jgi:nucleoside-diphosphate kinase
MKEKTFIIIKPDTVQRGLTGEIIVRFEKKGLKIVGMKLIKITREKAAYHYAEHQGKPFYEELLKFITSSPVVVMVLEGDNSILLSRKLAGATKIEEALPGTIRGDYAKHTNRNIVHTSDSPESAKREIENFFSADEILTYSRNNDEWI